MKAIEALYNAQKISFAPFVFQTAYCLLEFDILDEITKVFGGLSIRKISEKTGVSEYGVKVLVEMAEASDILSEDQGKYSLTKIGHFILRDEMTRINLNFTQDVCYQGLYELKDSIKNGKPEGLKVFGDWPKIYEALTLLPEKAKKSWFDFDHYYSDNSFDSALKVIFKNNPSLIYDIGGNTGKWAIASTKHNPDVNVTIFDLPRQLNAAQNNINKINEIKDRVSYHEMDILEPQNEIPGGADVYWMSQFLDCFSENEIEGILTKIRKNIKPDAKVYVMETFIDNQKYDAAKFSLVATSLYFTAMANGNSKMYNSSTMKYVIEKAGFKCVGSHDLHTKNFHTILEFVPV